MKEKNWSSYCWLCSNSRPFVKTSAGFWECDECGMAKSEGQIRLEQRVHGVGGGRGRRRFHHSQKRRPIVAK